MKNLTNEKLIKFNEKHICKLLDQNNATAIEVIKFLKNYYSIEDLKKGTVFYKVFEQVYIKRTKMPK